MDKKNSVLKVNLGGVNYPSFNSSDGVALELYLSGCAREPRCPGCHNPELWDFNYGKEIKLCDIAYMVMQKKVLDNIVVMGGEPLHCKNLLNLLITLKATGKKVWLYTSYEINQVPEDIKLVCDFIKTGVYDETQKVKDRWLASRNQRIYKNVNSDWELYYIPA